MTIQMMTPAELKEFYADVEKQNRSVPLTEIEERLITEEDEAGTLKQRFTNWILGGGSRDGFREHLTRQAEKDPYGLATTLVIDLAQEIEDDIARHHGYDENDFGAGVEAAPIEQRIIDFHKVLDAAWEANLNAPAG